ncbi:hypothetical protein [Azospirillum palustre]
MRIEALYPIAISWFDCETIMATKPLITIPKLCKFPYESTINYHHKYYGYCIF